MASEDIIPVEEEVEEEVVIEEEQPVVSPLNRLKCPNLARKRKVQTNPCKGVKKSKGVISFEPQKVSLSLELKNFLISIFLPIRENSFVMHAEQF